ncbi:FkbM family methyltransferase [Candidatus Peregrinibacteria bacterium]|nr:FkbM family methyltransferase [Candidatus Peregrinibacteria bacterium]
MVKNVKLFGKSLEIEIRSDADHSVFEEIFVDRDYKILDDVIKKADCPIVDIGAHIGCFSIYASVLNPSARVFAFEPEEENFKTLKENLKLNSIKNVIAKNLAVYGVSGVRDLYISKDSHNNSFVLREENSKKVNCVDFGSLIERFFVKGGYKFFSLVKMDCEGSEFSIFENFKREWFSFVKVFYIEYHEFSPEMKKDFIINLLKKNRYEVSVVPSFYDKRMGFITAY